MEKLLIFIIAISCIGCNNSEDEINQTEVYSGTWQYLHSKEINFNLTDPVTGLPLTTYTSGPDKFLTVFSNSTFNISVPSNSYYEEGLVVLDSNRLIFEVDTGSLFQIYGNQNTFPNAPDTIHAVKKMVPGMPNCADIVIFQDVYTRVYE